MYISGSICNVEDGHFSLGIYTQEGKDEFGNDFYEICIGFLVFEIQIGKIYKS